MEDTHEHQRGEDDPEVVAQARLRAYHAIFPRQHQTSHDNAQAQCDLLRDRPGVEQPLGGTRWRERSRAGSLEDS